MRITTENVSHGCDRLVIENKVSRSVACAGWPLRHSRGGGRGGRGGTQKVVGRGGAVAAVAAVAEPWRQKATF
jgi:hypothetical protein